MSGEEEGGEGEGRRVSRGRGDSPLRSHGCTDHQRHIIREIVQMARAKFVQAAIKISLQATNKAEIRGAACGSQLSSGQKSAWGWHVPS